MLDDEVDDIDIIVLDIILKLIDELDDEVTDDDAGVNIDELLHIIEVDDDEADVELRDEIDINE